MQETDHNAAVRGARIVLIDDQLIRAYMTASWLGQMNWEVYVLETDFSQVFTENGAWRAQVPQAKQIQRITSTQLNRFKQQQDIVIWDVSTFAQYKKGHIDGAAWLLKADAIELVQKSEYQTKTAIVLTCEQAILANFAAEEIEPYLAENQQLYVLEGGNAGWTSAGYTLIDNVIPCLHRLTAISVHTKEPIIPLRRCKPI